MSTSRNNAKKKCPYHEKCYRKNPIHFNEMSHPHLEKLILHQLTGPISIPDHLEFECNDRSELLDQLKVLQIVIRKEKENNGQSVKNKEIKKPTDITESQQQKLSDDLKAKVEKNKQEAIARKNKCLGINSLKSPNKDFNNTPTCSKSETLKVGIQETSVRENKSSDSKKRNSESSDNLNNSKRSKTSNDNSSNNASSNSNFDPSPNLSKSLLGEFTNAKSMKDRKELRKKAIFQMRSHGMKFSVIEPGGFALKFALSAPYHFFLTTVEKSKETYEQKNSVALHEILDESLGEIEKSLHINFMIDVGYLCSQYLLAAQKIDLLILYGTRIDTEKLPESISMIPINMPTSYGVHHSKIMVLKYTNGGIRIVVSTANLYSDDWENRTQGLWMSPHLPPLAEEADNSSGESPTKFKRDFEKYLLNYKDPALTEWIYLVRGADFSSVNVFFLASVPGSHKHTDWGHRKLGWILSNNATLPPDAPYWPIVAQSSSIGSLGANYESWLLTNIVASMSKELSKGLKSDPNFQFVYPTVNNYKQGFDILDGTCCLPYSATVHSKQKWLEQYLYQWKASKIGRNRAMPHIKTYTRISPDLKQIPWFVLTSANLSKAAWGTWKNVHYIMNYEAGVVFIPKFVTGATTFPIEEDTTGEPVFPMPYDLPLTRYEQTDKPFAMAFLDED
ncbi:probable tyrosyl-DNA phosphodiesterase [Prorops nasuta]|uniref:probable tyrosyl-DNA phosphodiesterase n=1 Tax=Prorops nasuta TaxID=863751 RepID=UPI0034CEF35F